MTYAYNPQLSNCDHVFAAFLRRHQALDNRHCTFNLVQWFNKLGQQVAFALYDNEACTYRVYTPEKPHEAC